MVRPSSMKVIGCLFLPLALSAPQAYGQDSDQERIVNQKTVTQVKIKKGNSLGFSVILGAEYGAMTATPADASQFGKKSGTSFELKGLAGFTFDDFLIDTGLGWYSYKIRGEEKVEKNGILGVGDRELGVSGLLVEFSPSYSLYKVNQVVPSRATGKGAANRRPRTVKIGEVYAGLVTQLRTKAQLDYFSEAPISPVGFGVGGQLGYIFTSSELNSRILFKVMTNVGLKKWSDIVYMGGVQFGLPVVEPDTKEISKKTIVEKARNEVEYQKRDFTITITANVVKLTLDNIVTFFVKNGIATLTPEAQSFLVDLGGSLQSALEMWETLRIDAETQSHMETVRESLVSTGVPENKVKMGRTLKAVYDGGNVSMDFTFTGVKDSRQLAESIRRAMSAMKIPENCQKGTCE